MNLLILVEHYDSKIRHLKAQRVLIFIWFTASWILRPVSQTVFSTHGSEFQPAPLSSGKDATKGSFISASILLWPMESPQGCNTEALKYIASHMELPVSALRAWWESGWTCWTSLWLNLHLKSSFTPWEIQRHTDPVLLWLPQDWGLHKSHFFIIQ